MLHEQAGELLGILQQVLVQAAVDADVREPFRGNGHHEFLRVYCIALFHGGNGQRLSLQVFVEKPEDFSNDFRVGDVHVVHAFLDDEAMFQPNLRALCGPPFHLGHTELLVQFAHTKKSWRIVGRHLGVGAVDANVLHGLFLLLAQSRFALCLSNLVEILLLE